MPTPSNNIAPAVDAEAFNCPQCGVFSRQFWYHLRVSEHKTGYGRNVSDPRFRVSYCESCSHPTIWGDDRMIYPAVSPAPMPNPDIPEDIRLDYNEARDIVNTSPRGAAALLRLAIQKICKLLGQPGENINADIKALVAKGLPVQVQQALDIVRVVGNEAVHPGTLDLRDDRDTALHLFRLVNFIADKMITEPKEVAKLYAGLPSDKRAAVDKRDK